MAAGFLKNKKNPLDISRGIWYPNQAVAAKSFVIDNKLKILKKDKKVVDNSEVTQYNSNVPPETACTL